MQRISHVCKYSLHVAFDGRVLDPRAIVGALLEAVLAVMKEAQVDDPKARVQAILDGIVLETVPAFSTSLPVEMLH